MGAGIALFLILVYFVVFVSCGGDDLNLSSNCITSLNIINFPLSITSQPILMQLVLNTSIPYLSAWTSSIFDIIIWFIIGAIIGLIVGKIRGEDDK